jgi:hypothetical protein
MMVYKEIYLKIKRIWDGFVENWLGASPLDRSKVTDMESIYGNDVYSMQNLSVHPEESI